MIRATTVVLFALLATRVSASPVLVAAYNENETPVDGKFWPYSIGWLWTPPTSFELTRVETKFSFGAKHVGIEVYDALPHLGGVLLASGSYGSVALTWGGADVGPISVIAGEDYLVSFTHTDDLGPNYADVGVGTMFSSDGVFYFDDDGLPPESFVERYPGQGNALVRVYGIVPEPASLTLAALGVLAIMRHRSG